jgi:phospholipid/cholesterol/gamma-HCH transport system ATP-binding protein
MIRLDAIRKRHFNPAAPPVLDGVSVSVAAGETWGLCGPGASGKSLLLKIICGLVTPEAGAVHVEDTQMNAATPAALRKAQAGIGMLFQNNALFDSMTVQDNVAFPVRQRARLEPAFAASLDPGELQARVASCLRAVGLADHAHKPPSQLSGGQRKRVALARAVIARPRLIIYDEPTAGLDPVTTAKIYDLLRREREETGATVLIVSSDIDALRAFAPRLAMLYRGRLLYDGPTAAIEQSEDPRVRQFIRGDLEGPL